MYPYIGIYIVQGAFIHEMLVQLSSFVWLIVRDRLRCGWKESIFIFNFTCSWVNPNEGRIGLGEGGPRAREPMEEGMHPLPIRLGPDMRPPPPSPMLPKIMSSKGQSTVIVTKKRKMKKLTSEERARSWRMSFKEGQILFLLLT
jgi:hypothetical protein